MKYVISFAIAFLAGSLPTGFLISKYVKGVDIRRFGSGNVGATNVTRVLGKGLGALVFIIDFAKGVLPAALLPRIVYGGGFPQELAVWIGLGAILGHIYTPFLGLKGGKGVATGAGVICGCYPVIFLIIISVWLAVFLATRIVSASSLAALGALFLCGLSFRVGLLAQLFFLFVLIIGIWTHRSNISRLLRGEEKRIR